MLSMCRKIKILFKNEENTEKAYFAREKLGSLKRKLPVLGLGIFNIFLQLRHFKSLSLQKQQGHFHPWTRHPD
jgi:hypothetical protein